MSKCPVVCWTWSFAEPSYWFLLVAVLFFPGCLSFSGDLSSCGPSCGQVGWTVGQSDLSLAPT